MYDSHNPQKYDPTSTALFQLLLIKSIDGFIVDVIADNMSLGEAEALYTDKHGENKFVIKLGFHFEIREM